MIEQVKETVGFLRSRLGDPPETTIVLGSGLGAFTESMSCAGKLDYSVIPNWPVSTAPGHAGYLLKGSMANKSILVMQGRVHYYEGYSPEQVVFPTRALAEWGTKNLILTNASGGINYSLSPGDLVLLHDHINLMGFNPLRGRNNDHWGERFPDMTYAYDEKLMKFIEKAASLEGILLKRGVYIAFAGPSYETPSEIRMARILGADVVGMSTVPEVIVANHMGLHVAAISCVANHAAGMKSDRLSEEEVLSEMVRSSTRLVSLLKRALEMID